MPVINMACCTYHPTQGLGDIMTIQNKIGNVRKKKYTITWAYSSKPRGRCSIQEEVLIAPIIINQKLVNSNIHISIIPSIYWSR